MRVLAVVLVLALLAVAVATSREDPFLVAPSDGSNTHSRAVPGPESATQDRSPPLHSPPLHRSPVIAPPDVEAADVPAPETPGPQVPAAHEPTLSERDAIAAAKGLAHKFGVEVRIPESMPPEAWRAVLAAHRECGGVLRAVEERRGPLVLSLAEAKFEQGLYVEFPHPSTVPDSDRAELAERIRAARHQALNEELVVRGNSKTTKIVKIPEGENSEVDELRLRAQTEIHRFLNTVNTISARYQSHERRR